MILECPSCAAHFEIGSSISVAGRKVRCSRCAHVWRVEAKPQPSAGVDPSPVKSSPPDPTPSPAARVPPPPTRMNPEVVPGPLPSNLQAPPPRVADTADAGEPQTQNIPDTPSTRPQTPGSAPTSGERNELPSLETGGPPTAQPVKYENETDTLHGVDGGNAEVANAGRDEGADPKKDSDKTSRTIPSLEEALGDLFAKPPVTAPPFVHPTDPANAPFCGTPQDRPAASWPSPSTGRPEARHPTETERREHAEAGGLTVPIARPAQPAPPFNVTLDETHPIERTERGKPSRRLYFPAETAQPDDAGFATPDQIAPDPTPTKSHVDQSTDAPFATDFSDPSIAGPLRSRSGRQVHRNLSRRRAMLTVGWFSLATIVGAAGGFVWSGRNTLVQVLPGTAELYSVMGSPINARGLDFDKITYRWTTDNGRPSLDVKGEIHNISNATLRVPSVVFVLLDGDEQELFNWAMPVRNQVLDAGARTEFEAQIPAPPKAAKHLRVRFARKSR